MLMRFLHFVVWYVSKYFSRGSPCYGTFRVGRQKYIIPALYSSSCPFHNTIRHFTCSGPQIDDSPPLSLHIIYFSHTSLLMDGVLLRCYGDDLDLFPPDSSTSHRHITCPLFKLSLLHFTAAAICIKKSRENSNIYIFTAFWKLVFVTNQDEN